MCTQGRKKKSARERKVIPTSNLKICPRLSISISKDKNMRHCAFPLLLNRTLLFYGLLCGMRWFQTDVSLLPIGPVFKGQLSKTTIDS
jgi:hypothetical protein